MAVSRLETIPEHIASMLDAFLDVPATMCARAGSRALRKKYSPPNRKKWWAASAVRFNFCQILQTGEISPQGASFLRTALGVQFQNVRMMACAILKNAMVNDKVIIADWFIKEFGPAAAFELGRYYGGNWIENTIEDFIRDLIDSGKLVAAEWLLCTFEIDFSNRLQEASEYAIITANARTLLWLEKLHQKWGRPLTVYVYPLLCCKSIWIVRYILEKYELKDWIYANLWEAIAGYAEQNRTQHVMYILWRFDLESHPGLEIGTGRDKWFVSALYASKKCIGRDGARLRKKLASIAKSAHTSR